MKSGRHHEVFIRRNQRGRSEAMRVQSLYLNMAEESAGVYCSCQSKDRSHDPSRKESYCSSLATPTYISWPRSTFGTEAIDSEKSAAAYEWSPSDETTNIPALPGPAAMLKGWDGRLSCSIRTPLFRFFVPITHDFPTSMYAVLCRLPRHTEVSFYNFCSTHMSTVNHRY